MTDYICPVEGCEYGEQGHKSLPAVRAHVNATNDHPDWSEVKPEVEAQGGGGGDEDPDPPAQPASDGDEYEEQWEQATNPEGQSPETPGDGPESGPNWGIPLWLVAAAAVVGGGIVLYLILRGDGGESEEDQEGQIEIEPDAVGGDGPAPDPVQA